MKVALDATFSALRFGGTGTYTRELASRLPHILGHAFVTIRCPRLPSPLRGRVGSKVETLYRDLWWTPRGAARAASSAGATLLHVPAPVGPTSLEIPFVLTVHDLSVLRFPEFFRPWFRTTARVVIPRAARAAAHVITVSEAAKSDILEHLALPADKLSVIPNGVAPEFRPVDTASDLAAEVRARYALPEVFALAVGVIEPRKNLLRLLLAVETLRSRPATADMTLVHVGPYGWLSRDVLRRAELLAAKRAVLVLGPVPANDLSALYSLARLTAYPSLYEGFGLPVLEAMACGSPVVTSEVGALPEVAGEAAVYVDPTSPESIAEGMERVWMDETLRARLRQRGLERAKCYTWEVSARRSAEVYQRVAPGLSQLAR
jgi:glycosyltransferase involved in cell wall biosynthesis